MPLPSPQHFGYRFAQAVFDTDPRPQSVLEDEDVTERCARALYIGTAVQTAAAACMTLFACLFVCCVRVGVSLPTHVFATLVGRRAAGRATRRFSSTLFQHTSHSHGRWSLHVSCGCDVVHVIVHFLQSLTATVHTHSHIHTHTLIHTHTHIHSPTHTHTH